MNTIAMWTGYAFMATCGWAALLWTWEQFGNATWKRCLDSSDFYKVALRYAHERKKGRKNGRVGFTDE